MTKLLFDILDSKVEELFSSELREGQTVDDRIIEIEKLIESSGWTVDEFELYRLYGALN